MAKTILVADDSKTMRTVVELTFRNTEFKVVGATNAQEAFEKAGQSAPDIVLADVNMGESNGYELCSSLKQNGPTAHVPVVLLTNALEGIDDGRLQAARANGHLKKPFDTQSLIDLVKSHTGVAIESEIPLSYAGQLAQKHAQQAQAQAQALPSFSAPAQEAELEPVEIDIDEPIESGEHQAPIAPAAQQLSPAPAELSSASAGPRTVIPTGEPQELQAEEIELLEEDEEQVLKGPPGVPTLEPPTPPTEAEMAHAAKVDVWALADDGGTPEAAPRVATPVPMAATPEAAPTVPANPFRAPVAPVEEAPAPAAAAVSAVAAAAAEPVAQAVAPSAPGLSKDELVALAKETIERIAWEVVPELAETIIRAELKRLTQDS